MSRAAARYPARPDRETHPGPYYGIWVGTNKNRPFGSLIWVSPLEMFLHSVSLWFIRFDFRELDTNLMKLDET
jgi:hypothetical protein